MKLFSFNRKCYDSNILSRKDLYVSYVILPFSNKKRHIFSKKLLVGKWSTGIILSFKFLIYFSKSLDIDKIKIFSPVSTMMNVVYMYVPYDM